MGVFRSDEAQVKSAEAKPPRSVHGGGEQIGTGMIAAAALVASVPSVLLAARLDPSRALHDLN